MFNKKCDHSGPCAAQAKYYAEHLGYNMRSHHCCYCDANLYLLFFQIPDDYEVQLGQEVNH